MSMKQVAPEHRRDLTVKEGAYILSVSYYWLWRRIGEPDGPPFFKRGRHIVLPKTEFLEWANQPVIAPLAAEHKPAA